MIISIIPDKIGEESYSEKWAFFLKDRGIEFQFVDFSMDDLFEKIRNSDGLMWRPAHNPDDKQKARRLLLVVEKYLKLPVYPNFNTYWHYDDKVSQYFLFQALNVPTPQTWVFWDKEKALVWAEQARYPLVHKLAVGAGSTFVSLINSVEKAKEVILNDFRGRIPQKTSEFKFSLDKNYLVAIIKRMKESFSFIFKADYPAFPKYDWQIEKNYSYFQEFLPDNNYDTRVTIIGERAFVFKRWNREDDFRASGSGLIDHDLSTVDLECVERAFDISNTSGFQSMAYDFIRDKHKNVVCEISYAFNDFAVYNCPGYWDSSLSWHEGHMWPEEAQVEDFLKQIECKKDTIKS